MEEEIFFSNSGEAVTVLTQGLDSLKHVHAMITYTHAQTYVHTSKHTRTYVHTYTHMQTYTCTHKPTCTPRHMYVHTDAFFGHFGLVLF